MRTIKFRIWLKNKKEMDYNDCFIRASGNPVIWQGDEQDTQNYVLMQFTGLKDKDGKEIYEGDIVKNNDYIWKIIFKEGAYYLDNLKDGGKWIILGEEQHCEIIGNIYSNPELLSLIDYKNNE